MVDKIRFKGQLSKWSKGRKIICVPTCLSDSVNEYEDHKIIVTIEPATE